MDMATVPYCGSTYPSSSIPYLNMGVAADSASSTGVMGVSWSYSQRASFTFVAWNVTWRKSQLAIVS